MQMSPLERERVNTKMAYDLTGDGCDPVGKWLLRLPVQTPEQRDVMRGEAAINEGDLLPKPDGLMLGVVSGETSVKRRDLQYTGGTFLPPVMRPYMIYAFQELARRFKDSFFTHHQ
ncbi:hypothetical protein NDU88_011633 [Pleurodeles waltl]|uniref:Uncharacterized protein n=1 Tax=Pleurodeles waltl TaxID=8319 RepID=A0AAV7Q3V4_PLEWA|nr:hypothetical protein NDU88_011633 [Pleurodeles waltl]